MASLMQKFTNVAETRILSMCPFISISCVQPAFRTVVKTAPLKILRHSIICIGISLMICRLTPRSVCPVYIVACFMLRFAIVAQNMRRPCGNVPARLCMILIGPTFQIAIYNVV